MTSLPDTESRAEFLVIGHSDAEVSDACKEMKQAYDNQCSTQTFSPDEIRCLAPHEMNQLHSIVDSLHLQVETNSSEELTVKGLKDGVNEVVKLTKDAFLREVRKINILGQWLPTTFMEALQHCTFCISPLSGTPISGLGVSTNELMI